MLLQCVGISKKAHDFEDCDPDHLANHATWDSVCWRSNQCPKAFHGDQKDANRTPNRCNHCYGISNHKTRYTKTWTKDLKPVHVPEPVTDPDALAVVAALQLADDDMKKHTLVSLAGGFQKYGKYPEPVLCQDRPGFLCVVFCEGVTPANVKLGTVKELHDFSSPKFVATGFRLRHQSCQNYRIVKSRRVNRRTCDTCDKMQQNVCKRIEHIRERGEASTAPNSSTTFSNLIPALRVARQRKKANHVWTAFCGLQRAKARIEKMAQESANPEFSTTLAPEADRGMGQVQNTETF